MAKRGRPRVKLTKEFLITAYEKQIEQKEAGMRMCDERRDYLQLQIYELRNKINTIKEGKHAV